MRPPAGRLQVEERVLTPGGRHGRIVAERLIASNGAWSYMVAFDEGGTAEFLDYELRRLAGG
jgi:hypothetical protein